MTVPNGLVRYHKTQGLDCSCFIAGLAVRLKGGEGANILRGLFPRVATPNDHKGAARRPL